MYMSRCLGYSFVQSCQTDFHQGFCTTSWGPTLYRLWLQNCQLSFVSFLAVLIYRDKNKQLYTILFKWTF